MTSEFIKNRLPTSSPENAKFFSRQNFKEKITLRKHQVHKIKQIINSIDNSSS